MEKHTIVICMGSSCFARGNDRNLAIIENFMSRNGIENEILLRGSRCEGSCPAGPNITIDGEAFSQVCPENLEGILERIFLEGKEVKGR